MKLYYLPGACSLASHILLEWLGAAYDTHKLSHDQLKAPDYLQVNPAGAVPALALDDRVLTQNAAILPYLAASHGATQLLGTTPLERAEVNHWLGVVNSDMHPAFKPLFGATGYLGDDTTIEQTKAHAKQTLRPLFERVERRLQTRDWIAGSRSIADPYFYVMVRWAHMMGIDISDLQGIQRFEQRMENDSAVRKALADEGLI